MDDLQGKKILIIDDDPTIQILTKNLLKKEGCDVSLASDGKDGLRQLYAVHPDLVVLDIHMPVMDGWQTLINIRQLSDVPILILTSQNFDEDIVKGLELGADDYLTKPFNPKVLLARMKLALRHTAELLSNEKSTGYGDSYLTINLFNRNVQAGGKTVKLSAKEFNLLAFLVENTGQVLTARQILEHVWGWEYQDSLDYVRVYITHLRQKIEPDPRNPKYLITEHGTGYRFEKSII